MNRIHRLRRIAAILAGLARRPGWLSAVAAPAAFARMRSTPPGGWVRRRRPPAWARSGPGPPP